MQGSLQSTVFLSHLHTQTIDITTVSTLEELDNEEEMNELSVRQVKIMLQRNCINYKGCVEKEELLEKLKTLWRAKEEDRSKCGDKLLKQGCVA